MAKKTKTEVQPDPVGRPSEYDPKYCDQLIDHMKQGGNFKSFAGKLRHTEQTLYNWSAAHPEFLESKKIGEGMSLEFYLTMGRMMATGQIRRVKSEKPVIVDGKVLYDKDGHVLMEREYEYTNGAQSVWIFMMKNLHKWRDRHDFNLAGQPPDPDGKAAPPITFDFTGMSKEALERRMNELLLKGISDAKEKTKGKK